MFSASAVQAQCNASGFTVTRTNGTCLSNASISVQVPGGVTCAGWTAILTRPDNSENSLAIPANGGPVVFTGLAAGTNYRVRLYNGITTIQWSGNPITLTTSYVSMVVNTTSTAPTCNVAAPGYTPNGTLTINKTSGGIGPFVYTVSSILGTQTSGPTAATSHTFTGMGGGLTTSINVLDQAGGNAGCQVSVSQTPTMAASTSPDFVISVPSYSYFKQCAPNCNNMVMHIAITPSPSASQQARMLTPGNSTISINGGLPQNLTSFNNVPIPPGANYIVSVTDGCYTHTYSSTAPVPNAAANIFIGQNTTYTNCVPNYFITTVPGSAHWCANTTVQVLLRDPVDPSIFTPVPGSPFPVTTGINNNIPVPSTGYYRLVYSDGCYTSSRDFVVSPPVNPINQFNNIGSFNTMRAGSGSIAVGGAGNNYNLPGNVSYPVTISVMPTSGATSLTYSASNPFQLAGSYTINFPIVKTLPNQSSGGQNVITDIPGGINYTITISDACGNSIVRTYTPPAATYNPVITTTVGCNNSNSISYNLNSPGGNHATVTYGGTWPDARYALHLDAGGGVAGALVSGYGSPSVVSGAYKSATFNNLPSGNYVVRFSGFTRTGWNGCYPSESSPILVCNQVYSFPVRIPVYQDVTINTQTVLCTDSTGIILAIVTGGTPIYPFIYTLSDDLGNVIRRDTAHTSASPIANNISYNNLDTGNYVLNVISGYSPSTPNGCYSVDRNVDLFNSQTSPQITASDTVVCATNTAVTLGLPVDSAFWNITWYDATGNILDSNVNNIVVNPTLSTTYSVQFQLKDNVGCLAPPLLIDTITLRLIDEPATNNALLGSKICPGVDGSITVLAADSGSIYEIYQNNATLNPRIFQTANTNGDLVFNIPQALLQPGMNVFQVHASNFVCSGDVLDSTVTIIVDTIPPRFLENDTIITVACAADLPALPSGNVSDGSDIQNMTTTVFITDSTCANKFTRTAQLIATDNCGLTDTLTQTVIVNDTIAPTFNGILPVNITASCDSVPTPSTLTAMDNCSATATVTFTEDTLAGSCANSYTLTRTWTATDACGNDTIHVQTITVVDNIPPTFVETLPGDTTVDCDAIPVASTLTATDNCSLTNTVTFTENTLAGSCANAYTLTRTWTATDACNNVTTHVQSITVQDTVPPTFVGVLPANITVDCDVVPAPVTLTATDNCSFAGTVTFTEDTVAGTWPVAYTLNRTWTAVDACNNSSEYIQTVTVRDTVAPVLSICPTDIVITNDAGTCSAIATWVAPTATDNCAATVTVTNSHTPGDTFPIGTTTVTYIFMDSYGNADTCAFDVTVNDVEDPTFTGCPSDITMTNDLGLCGATVTWTAPTATDGCSIVTVISSHNSGDIFPVGTTTVTYTATDVAGNTDTCSFTVTVNDTELPIIANCPADIVSPNTATTCEAAVNWTIPTTTDNCLGVVLTSTHNPGDVFPIGTTTVTYTATDAAGNTATCSFTVTVNDTQAPLISGCPANISVNNTAGACEAVVNWTLPSLFDNCAGATLTSTHNSGTSFPVGTTTVTYTAVDAAGLMDTCTFTVTVLDTENPVLTVCPANITATNDAGICGASVNWTAPTATDNCAGTVSITSTHNSGDIFPVGTTTVTYTATDVAGNTDTCSFTVTVNDTELPIIANCPADIVSPNTATTCGAAVTWTVPTTTDNCPGVVLTSTHNPGDVFPIGTTTVTYTATDAAGLTDTCSFTVTVNDAELPVLQGNCQADIAANTGSNDCDASVSWTVPVFTDNCAGLVVTSTHTPGTAFPIGTTTVTYTATDAAGNTTTCSFNITVSDVQAPILVSCPVNITLSNNPGLCGAIHDWILPTVLDNCPGSTLTTTHSPGTLFPVGVTTVTYTATDASGNSASCSFNVTVVDNEIPVINCPANITASNDTGNCDATVTWTAPVPSDNCGVASVTSTHQSGSVFPLGTTTVTYTVTDIHGNTANCSFNITVEDNDLPMVSGMPSDIVSCNDTITWIEPTATDNCGTVTITSSHQPGDVFPIGLTTVVYTFTDSAGNVYTESFLVNISKPTLTMMPTHITCNGLQNGSMAVIVNNAIEPYTYDWGNFGSNATITNLAPGTYSVTVTDSLGCMASASATITEPAVLVLSITDIQQSICGFSDGAAQTATNGGTAPYTYQWSNGQQGENLYGVSDDTYSLTVSDSRGCTDSITVTIECEFGRIPQLVSPNGDGLNDTWIIPGIDKFKDAVVEIYNRWGNQVFIATPYNNNWDGKSDGMLTVGKEKLPAGTYFYVIKLTAGSKALSGYLELQY